MKETTINKAEKFADGMVHSLAIYRAIEEAKQNPEATPILEEIIISLAQQAIPAEA